MKRIGAAVLSTAIVFSSILTPGVVMAEQTKENDFPVLAEFNAYTDEGEAFTQDILKDKDITLIYFWATYCGYCIDEMPEIAAFLENMPANVQMLSICGDGLRNQDTIKQIREKTGLDLPAIVDADQDLLKLFSQTIYTPTLYIADKDGNIILEPLIGAPKDLEAVYTELLDQAFETLEIEPVYEDAAAEEENGEDTAAEKK